MPKVSLDYKQERRTRLVEAAEVVFLRLGYTRTTMQDILDEAHVSRGGLYLYFVNKAEIFEAVLASHDARVMNELEQLKLGGAPLGPGLIAMLTPSGPFDEQSRRWITMTVEYQLEHRDDPDRRTKILSRLEQFVIAFCALIQDGVDSGEFHPQLPIQTTVIFLINSQDGNAIQSAIMGEEGCRPNQYGEAIALFLRTGLGF